MNGVEYKDPELPILNYEGSTYVPLAKLGDLTGFNYKWNDTLKQVEIGGAPVGPVETTPAGTSEEKKTDCNIAGQKGATLCPDTVIEWPEEPGYKGHADSEDPSYQWAIDSNADDLPPLLSEGWISDALLDIIEGIDYGGTGVLNQMKLSKGPQWNETILATFNLTQEFVSAKDGDFTINDIRIKKYDWDEFFNISDLQKAGIIKE